MYHPSLRIAREEEVLIFLSALMVIWALSYIRSEIQKKRSHGTSWPRNF